MLYRKLFLLLISLLTSCEDDDILSQLDNMSNSFQWNWSKALSGPSNEDEIDAVASDTQGNVYVSGKFENQLSIDGSANPIVSNGDADIMVIKYDKDGNWQWTKHFGGSGEDNVFDVICDKDGNVFLSGYFQGIVQFGNYELNSYSGLDMMVIKINPSGEVLWAKQYGGSGNEGGNEIEISNSNEIIVGAQSDGTFEGIANTGNQDAYVLSLNSDGSVNWVQAIQGNGDARAKAIEVDAQGNVFLGGDYRNSTIIDNNGTEIAFDNYGKRDAYLASWTSNGTFRWLKTWGGTGNDLCKGVAVTSEDQIWIVGQFDNTVNFDGNELIATDQTDLFVWKLQNNSASIWLRQISSNQDLSGAEIAVDNEDNLIFGLGLAGSVTFESSNSEQVSLSLTGTGRTPILVKYDSQGSFKGSLMAVESFGDAYFGELSISNQTVYIDCAINGGPHSFGSDSFFSEDDSKDAVIVSVKL